MHQEDRLLCCVYCSLLVGRELSVASSSLPGGYSQPTGFAELPSRPFYIQVILSGSVFEESARATAGMHLSAACAGVPCQKSRGSQKTQILQTRA